MFSVEVLDLACCSGLIQLDVGELEGLSKVWVLELFHKLFLSRVVV